MEKEQNPMSKFNFLLGKWKMKYNIPKSRFSEKDHGEGEGEFKLLLNDKFVSFDYAARFSSSDAAAHAVFRWDENLKLYKYWWYENSGAFSEATCDFTNENTLNLNWHNSLLVQSFKKISNEKVILHMKYPADDLDYDLVLEVILTKEN